VLLNRYAFGFRHDSTSKLAERLSYIYAYQTILGYALVEHQHTHLDSRKGLTCSLSRVEVVAEIINRRHEGSHMFCTYLQLQSYAPASLTVRDLHQHLDSHIRATRSVSHSFVACACSGPVRYVACDMSHHNEHM
jgi:hypothetical protein